MRRLRVLIKGLPSDARLWVLIRQRMRESNAPGMPVEQLSPEAWSETDHQIAALRDQMNQLIWMYQSTHRAASSSAPPQPDPVPRPGGIPRARRRVNAFFSAFGLPEL